MACESWTWCLTTGDAGQALAGNRTARAISEAAQVEDAEGLTEVGADVEGDVHFPDWSPGEWREVWREPGVRGPKDEADFTFVDYERAGPAV